MTTMRAFRRTIGYAWRVALCAVAYVVGAVAGGAAVSALGLPRPQLPEQADAGTMGLLMLIDSIVYAWALTALLVRKGEARADEQFVRYLLCVEQSLVVR